MEGSEVKEVKEGFKGRNQERNAGTTNGGRKEILSDPPNHTHGRLGKTPSLAFLPAVVHVTILRVRCRPYDPLACQRRRFDFFH
jgi:hypothetical protein